MASALFIPGVMMTRKAPSLRDLLERYGQSYSELLAIDLRSGRNEEIVKWFLAAILYSKPIRESSATKTYRCFAARGVTSSDAILRTGWDGLVTLLDAGGYTRYDFSTATKLLAIFGNLKKEYGGDLNRLHEQAKDPEDLENRLKDLGKGIGDTTISIFLRDMRMAWKKANPKPTPLVQTTMERLKIKNLDAYAKQKHLDPVRLDTTLLRLGRDFVKKGKPIRLTAQHSICSLPRTISRR
jgi:hypothetical protein